MRTETRARMGLAREHKETDNMRAALTRTRRRRALAGAITTLLVMAGAAFGYYLIFANGAGSGSAPLGTGKAEPLTLTAQFAPGLVPGKTENVVFDVKNETHSLGKVAHLAWTAAINSPYSGMGCQSEWFSVQSDGLDGEGHGEAAITPAVEVAPGETKELDSANLTFKELASTNQSSCEGATLTLNLTSSPS